MAWGFADDWFDGGEDVRTTFGTPGVNGFRPDPLALCPDGASMSMPICDPRKYFLWLVGNRMEQIRMEWDKIVQDLNDELDQ